mgnify:CR=1 FL=1
MRVKEEAQQTEDNTSLMNYAAKKVIDQGGSVFLLESAFMPEKDTKNVCSIEIYLIIKIIKITSEAAVAAFFH